MFEIYRYNICGRKRETYFQKWDNAQKAMDEETQMLIKEGWTLQRRLDYFNAAKGFYVYEKELTKEGMTIRQSIIEGYFAD